MTRAMGATSTGPEDINTYSVRLLILDPSVAISGFIVGC